MKKTRSIIFSKIRRPLIIIITGLALLCAGTELDAQTKKKNTGKATTTKNATKSKSGAATGKANTSKGKQASKKKGSVNKIAGKETVSEVKARESETRKEIALTKEQIKANEAEVKKGLNELGKLQTDIEEGKKKLAQATGEVKSLEGQIATVEGTIAKEEGELKKLRDEYLKAVKQIRAKKKAGSSLSFIFSSKNFNEALRRIRYLRRFSEWRDKRNNEITAKVTDLKKQKEILAQAKIQKDAAVKNQTAAQTALNKQYSEQDAMVVKLKANGQALKNHLAQKQSEANQLKNRISALIAEEQRRAEAERKAREEAERKAKAEAERQAKIKAEQERQQQLAREAEEKARKEKEVAQATPKKEEKKTEKRSDKKKETKKETKNNNTQYADARKRRPRSEKTNPSSTSSSNVESTEKKTVTATTNAGGNFASMKGSLPRPVSGAFKITSRFGRHSLPDLPDVMYDNPGIDAETSPGASAQAVYAGKVTGVYMIPGYSTVVIVNHGSYFTVYGNIQSPSVKVGDSVKQGQGLGKLAADEDDPSHSSIHFEVWHNRDKQNPTDWIR